MKLKILILIFVFLGNSVLAGPRQVDEYQWEGVDRIVAVGDIHGDYANYIATLNTAGLLDKKGKWAGGKTHLVQTGDIPDRGPDTQKIIEHISELAKQAEKAGGRVHSLIGNHEAMNVYGDLRYVHPGEFEAFKTRKSAALRDRYFELYMKGYQQQDPEGFAALPENFRDQWNVKHPLGWVEHRQAWDPAWNPEGEYANWVMDKKVAIRINDNLFLHGGLSGFYCANTLDSMTEKVVGELRQFDPANPGTVEDEFGPLWYRGLSGVDPHAAPETVDAILKKHDAGHIVVGHTPTSGVIWPGYDGKVIQIDTGIASSYGGHIAYLEITPEGHFAGYPLGKLELPASDEGAIAYLEKVIAMDPDNPYLQERLEKLMHPAVIEPVAGEPANAESANETDQAGMKRSPPICGISP